MQDTRRWMTAAALAAAAVLGGPAVSTAFADDPNGDAFTYQGKLTQGGAPVTEAVDLQFTLFDALEGGNQVGVTLSAAAFDAFDDSGLFTIDLAFGKGVLNGSPRWLEISVNGTPLSPRQPLMPAPYAVRALTIGTLADASFVGSYTNQVDLSNASNQFSGSGAGLTGLNASNISSGTLSGSVLGGTYGNALTFSNAANSFSGMFSGTHSGSGAGLTGLNASNISGGTLSDARLSSNVAMRNVANTFTANNVFNGNVGIGAVADAKLLVTGPADEDAFRVRVGGTTRLLVGPNGGVAVGSNATDVPAGGLRVSGRVGSGTSDPEAWLHVARPNASNTPQMYLQSTSNNGFARLRMSTEGHSSYWDIAAGGSDNRVDFWNSETGSLMYLQGSTERVGIGTTNPQTKLEVAGAMRSNQSLGGGTAPVIGSVHKDNVIHAWARVRGDGVLMEGYGISNVFRLGNGRYDVMYSQVYPNAPIPVVTVRSANDPVFAIANAITDRVTVVTQAFVGGNFSASDREFYIILTGRVQN